MERYLGRLSPWIYALMRLVAGALFACHGAQKLFGVLGGKGVASAPMMVAAGVIEFGAGVLVAVGLGAGFAAFLASGQMAVAYFKAHGSRGFWPIENGGELAVLYCFVFLYIATRGSGSLSLDQLFRRQSPKARS
jgi:putative oxidoreductase